MGQFLHKMIYIQSQSAEVNILMIIVTQNFPVTLHYTFWIKKKVTKVTKKAKHTKYKFFLVVFYEEKERKRLGLLA